MTFSTRSELLLYITAAALLPLAYWLKLVPLYAVPLALLTYAAVKRKDDRLPRTALPLLAIALLMPIDLSDDAWRYTWEGFVQWQGYSPYQHAPESLYPKLDHPAEGLVNHPDRTAIYPPLAQYIFATGARLTHSMLGWKAMILLFMVLFACTPVGKRSGAILLAPLFIVEGLWNAHLDVLGVFAAVLMMDAVVRDKPKQAGLWLGVTAAVKLMPFIMLPAVVLHFGFKRGIPCALVAVGFVLLTYLPFLDHGLDLFTSFMAFSQHWHFNNIIFTLLDQLVPAYWVRPIMGSFLGTFLIIFTLYPAPLRQKLLRLWIVLFVFSPISFPWYLLWLLPFAAPSQRTPLHLAFAASCLSYLVLIPYRAEGIWQEAWWWYIPEWIALFICFALMWRTPPEFDKVAPPTGVADTPKEAS